MGEVKVGAVMVLAALLLTACSDHKKQEAAFVQKCSSVGFSQPQCLLLLDLYKGQEESGDAAAVAMTTSAVSQSMAISSMASGRR